MEVVGRRRGKEKEGRRGKLPPSTSSLASWREARRWPPMAFLSAVTSDDGPAKEGRIMYMAASSGMPEIKTILSGFGIPGFINLKVLVVEVVEVGVCCMAVSPTVVMFELVGEVTYVPASTCAIPVVKLIADAGLVLVNGVSLLSGYPPEL